MSCKKINFPSGINTIPILPQPVMLLLENWFIYDNLMPLWNYNMFVCTKARPQEDSPAKLCLCLPNKLNSRCLLGSLSASFHAFLVKLHWTLLHFDSPTQQTPQSFLDGRKKTPHTRTKCQEDADSWNLYVLFVFGSTVSHGFDWVWFLSDWRWGGVCVLLQSFNLSNCGCTGIVLHSWTRSQIRS